MFHSNPSAYIEKFMLSKYPDGNIKNHFRVFTPFGLAFFSSHAVKVMMSVLSATVTELVNKATEGTNCEAPVYANAPGFPVGEASETDNDEQVNETQAEQDPFFIPESPLIIPESPRGSAPPSPLRANEHSTWYSSSDNDEDAWELHQQQPDEANHSISLTDDRVRFLTGNFGARHAWSP
jgi:hypothetical protein